MRAPTHNKALHQTGCWPQTDRDETEVLHIGLASCIVQDGNYEDFWASSEYRFAPLFIRDPDRIGYVETKATDAWNDDQGHASYILECELR